MGAILGGVSQMDRYIDDFDWLQSNYDRLIKNYPDKYVAVFDGRVVASSEMLSSLLDELEVLRFDCNESVIEFIYKEHPHFVLI